MMALIALSLILLVAAILARTKPSSPVMFTQERVEKDGVPFYMYKFCSVSDARDSDGNSLPDEQRLSKFGAFLRSTLLDELPLFWNVVCGKVAMVGHRALYVKYISLYSAE